MDVVKSKSHEKMIKSKYLVATILAALVITFMISSWQKAASVSVFRKDILVERVERGNLEVVTEGYGVLNSNKQQLLTTLTRATVKEIVLKPGANVTAESVIVRLDNPELVQ